MAKVGDIVMKAGDCRWGKKVSGKRQVITSACMDNETPPLCANLFPVVAVLLLILLMNT